jgi:CelD/BcsL family acetyltransferase involved in cellulose biosynthesis
MRGARILSMPFSDFCDPLVTDAGQWASLVDPLLAEGKTFVIRPLHNAIPNGDPRLKLTSKAKWHGIDTSRAVDTMWSDLESSARRAIKKAGKSGVTVRKATRPELREFFNLHFGIRKYKYRLLSQPYSFFENIWAQFMEDGNGFVLLALHEDVVIGACLFLTWQDTLTYKFSASHADYMAYRPTDVIIWEAMQLAAAEGFSRLDLGLSDWDQDGLVRFKRKFATEEKTISFLKYLPDGPAQPYQQQAGGLLPRLTDLFTQDDVPDAVTEEAGGLLYGFFV